MSRTAAPKVPGQSAQPEAVEETTAPVVVVEQAAETGSANAQPETVTVEKSTLEALMAQVATLSAKVSGMESAKQAGRPAAAKVELPHADSIDPTQIKSPVLTKQGWVVPEKFGANPNAPKGF